MSALSVAGLAVPPAVGLALVAQAAGAVADPTGLGLIRLVTDTAVGACVLICVLLFLRRDRERDARDREREAERDARDRERDDAIRQIADDFREDVKAMAARAEAGQASLVMLVREVVGAVTGLNHSVQQLDATVRVLSERQTKLEHHVYVAPASLSPEDRPSVEGPRR